MADGSPIIVKKIKKGGAGHHGGAWKVAYADFVTAMMAFFLLLWLLNAVSDESLEGISNYFAPQSLSATTSGAGGILAGQVLGDEGASQRNAASQSVTLSLPPPKAGIGGDENSNVQEFTREEAEIIKEAVEQKMFDETEKALKEAIESVPDLQGFTENLKVDKTDEGLRIQLVDQQDSSMFPSGRADLFPDTSQLLSKIVEVISKLPQKIAINGHTDATPFITQNGYTNWELSADRALAARRAMLDAGLSPKRIARVVGKAETEPLVEDNPFSPQNRRLSIILLKEAKPEDAAAN
ncbi:flagellar motor protein MotB [Alphaproteobacteria bacterium HT1-32]|nr:flagellar motor protein MotB [Alphaproteobacteria bacterium HT1-32]|tara:strand:+ start:774 stop:1661 length:888 start_codon:yes stop_codon:yes gene_type:complete